MRPRLRPPGPPALGRPAAALAVAFALAAGLAGGGLLGFAVRRSPETPVRQADGNRSLLASGATRGGGAVQPDTLLVWTPRQLPGGFADAVGRLPGVAHAVAVASGTAWVTGSTAADGVTLDRVPRGMALPIEVGGAVPGRLASFLPPADRDLLPDLARGEGILGATSALLRRAGSGADLLFGHIPVPVAGVVADADIGAQELFVSKSTAVRLGVTRERYLLVDPASQASAAGLPAKIRSLLPPGVPARIRGPGETPYFRQGDAVLPPVVLKELFGEFAARPLATGWLQVDPAWVATHIVTARVPILGAVRCNRSIIPQLRGALQEVRSEGLSNQIDPSGYEGCFAPRFVNRDPALGISHHSWGVALDINVPTNRFGSAPRQDPRVVAIFERWGFTWGGQWLVPDGSHFEFNRPPSAA